MLESQYEVRQSQQTSVFLITGLDYRLLPINAKTQDIGLV